MGEIIINPKFNINEIYNEVILVNPYRFGIVAPPIVNNTFIGGVGTILTTKELLAEKIGISVTRISNFEIINNNIQCHITGTYSSIGNWIGAAYNAPTYYEDIDGLITGALGGSLYDCIGVNYLYLPNVTAILNDYFYYANYSGLAQGVYYLPKLESIGATAGKDTNNFGLGTGKPTKLYCSPILATSDAGGVEGDLTYGITKLVTPTYVQNFTAPNPITNLSIGNVYATVLQLNFTAPTGSTNAIDFYEVYLNGSRTPYAKITASGQYIEGLTLNTVYNIEVKPVDIYYNKSTSNIVTQLTAEAYYVDTASLVSYYKMENNVLDSWGTNNGTPNNITYASGLVGQTAVFNGTTSKIIIPDNNLLSFTDGTNDKPFSIAYSIKTTGTKFMILSKLNATYTINEYFIYYNAGNLVFRIFSGGTSANNITQSIVTNTIITGNWVNVVHTYNGLGNGGMKTYINGVLISSTNTMTGTYVKMANTATDLWIGDYQPDGTFKLNGSLDEIALCLKEVSAGEVSEINAKLLSGQSLI